MKIGMKLGLKQNIKGYLKDIRAYFTEGMGLHEENPRGLNLWQLIRIFPNWQRSLNGKSSPLLDEQPWLTYAATQFLSQVLNKDMRIFEYGVGGSSLYFLRRVKEVSSVEHDPLWFSQVLDSTKTKGYKNWSYFLQEPTGDLQSFKQDPSDPDGYISDDKSVAGRNFKNYAASIDGYDDNYFDLILIDGRARPSCFKHAIPKVRDKGFIVLDNAERDYYSYIHQTMKELAWDKQSFYGPGPYVRGFWETCIWQKVSQQNLGTGK